MSVVAFCWSAHATPFIFMLLPIAWDIFTVSIPLVPIETNVQLKPGGATHPGVTGAFEAMTETATRAVIIIIITIP